MPENTLLRYFFSSGSEVDPEDRFHLNRKTRTRRLKEISDICLLYTSPSPRDRG